jgi:hypothetical protein
MSDWGIQQAHLSEAISIVTNQLTRPSVLYKPRVFPDGDRWLCLYGPNIQEGVCAYGKTPDEAVENFDFYAWLGKPIPEHRS